MKRFITAVMAMLLLALSAAPAALAAVNDGEIAEDGININVATVWIIAVCALHILALTVITIILAKKNKGEKES